MTTTTEVLKTDQEQEQSLTLPGIEIVDINGKLPDLNKKEVSRFDLMSEYWTPEAEGEFKNVIFLYIRDSKVLEGDELLPHAYFLENTEAGKWRQVCNASKRLVGKLFESRLKTGTALRITYKGKVKNKTNSRLSDNWSVNPFMK